MWISIPLKNSTYLRLFSSNFDYSIKYRIIFNTSILILLMWPSIKISNVSHRFPLLTQLHHSFYMKVNKRQQLTSMNLQSHWAYSKNCRMLAPLNLWTTSNIQPQLIKLISVAGCLTHKKNHKRSLGEWPPVWQRQQTLRAKTLLN